MVDVHALVESVFRQEAPASPGSLEAGPPRAAAPRADPIKEVFVSYAWTPESERIVDGLGAALEARGIKLLRDKNELHYKESIREFMKRIGAGKGVVLIISRRYLESPNCMFELNQVAKQGDFSDRVFPIVLADAAISDVSVRLDYVKYWENQKKQLNKKMKSVGQENLEGIREEIDLYARVRETVARLTDVLADMNTLTAETLQRSGFEELYRKLDARLSASA